MIVGEIGESWDSFVNSWTVLLRERIVSVGLRRCCAVAAVRVWRDPHTAILAPFVSGRQDPVRQTRPASVTGRRA